MNIRFYICIDVKRGLESQYKYMANAKSKTQTKAIGRRKAHCLWEADECLGNFYFKFMIAIWMICVSDTDLKC